MTALDVFLGKFAERAANWDDFPGDLEDGPIEPWTDPDHPDERLDAAYRGGVVPEGQRWTSDFTDRLSPAPDSPSGGTAPAKATSEWPTVTAADALDDGGWFALHPGRRFRLRRGDGYWWVIRRQGAVLLRTFTAPPGAEGDIETLWYVNAWPHLTPKQRKRLIKKRRVA